MLVLSRKKNESVIIDGQIKIEILKIKGNTIRLGITAPKDIKVLRGELAPFGKESQFVVESESDLGNQDGTGPTGPTGPLTQFVVAQAS